MEPVTVVLVHWNNPDRCIESVASFRSSTVPVDLLIVDSGSTDDAWTTLTEAVGDLAGVEAIRLADNVGYGPGANAGWRHWLTTGSGEWVGLAPHDALVDDETIDRLLEAAAVRPRAGLVSADVGDEMSPVIDRYFGGILRPGETERGWEPVHHPHGTLFLARRSMLIDIGLFDERYFSYCEEADLGERARRSGWEVGLVRGARVYNPHLGGGVAVVDYLQVRNTLLLVRDHFGRYPAFIRLVTVAIQTVVGTVSPRHRPPVFDLRARIRAVRDHLRGRYGSPPRSF